MSVTKEKHESLSKGENNKPIEYYQVANKFRAYRLSVESADKKLKEAEAVIDQMKNEINFSRDVESNLRNQISFAQDRLISLQMTLKKFIIVVEQQKQIEEKSELIEHKVQEIREKIELIRQESQTFFNYTSKEMELIKKIKNLESVLTVKNTEYDLLKMQNLTLNKEKIKMEAEFQEKLKNLEMEVEKSIKNEREAKVQCQEALLHYKQQIEEYEQTIERYEKERKSFLEDFDFPQNPKPSLNTFTWADSTTIHTEESCTEKPTSLTRKEPEMDSDTQIFQCSPFVKKSKVLSIKKTKDVIKTSKSKPQLDFLTQPRESFQPTNNKPKRRLFSTNCNHYID